MLAIDGWCKLEMAVDAPFIGFRRVPRRADGARTVGIKCGHDTSLLCPGGWGHADAAEHMGNPQLQCGVLAVDSLALRTPLPCEIYASLWVRPDYVAPSIQVLVAAAILKATRSHRRSASVAGMTPRYRSEAEPRMMTRISAYLLRGLAPGSRAGCGIARVVCV